MAKIFPFTQETLEHISRVFNDPLWMKNKRKEAFSYFASLPMPKENHEEWRYTDISKISLEPFVITGQDKMKLTLPDPYANKGIIFMDLKTAMQKHADFVETYFVLNTDISKDKFLALNTAFWHQGYFLYIPKNLEVTLPIKVLIDTDQSLATCTHSIIIVDSNSKLNFIEEYSSKALSDSLHAGFVEIFAKDKAKVNFFTFHNWNNSMNNFSIYKGHVSRDASINWILGCFGGKLCRLKIDTYFNGPGANGSTVGVYYANNSQHIDITTNAIHIVPNTTNDIRVNGVLKDNSTAVYRGLIKIEEKAKQTISYLENHNLLLNEKALANSIPSLQIDTNDVKASHGATVGQVDEEQLFYLMTRGLTREEAEKTIVDGFFEPILQKVPDIEMRERFKQIIAEK